MKPPLFRALQGLALSLGSPLGWLALRVSGGADPFIELVWHTGIYLYLTFGTAAAFVAFGWYVGHHEERQLERALHDELTGLYNLRYFRRRLQDEVGFARRHHHAVALLVGDLDWFKRVNDTWGHGAGDRVLAAVAHALVRMRRRGDTVARIGGEEFGIILPETDLPEALEVAERMRRAITALCFPAGEGPPEGITISFGAAASPAGAPLDAPTLRARADAALYQAKQSGRDRVSPAIPALAA